MRELLSRETFEGIGWEPACGNGAITKFFPGIMASDIREDEEIAGDGGIDFLSAFRHVDFIVTNPPYKLALPFARHALNCAWKVALLCRIQFLEGIERHAFFQEHPPIRVWIFSDRIHCSADGKPKAGMMCFGWFIWERGFQGKPILDWILTKRVVKPLFEGR